MTIVMSQETSLDDVPAALPLKSAQQQEHPILADVAPQVAKIQVLDPRLECEQPKDPVSIGVGLCRADDAEICVSTHTSALGPQVSFGFPASPRASALAMEHGDRGVVEGDETDVTRDTPSTPNHDGDVEKTPSDPGALQQDSAP
eukprot:3425606-Rhodomonas_salina.1